VLILERPKVVEVISKEREDVKHKNKNANRLFLLS